MDNMFPLFALECDGDLPTRSGRINKAIKMLINEPCRNDPNRQLAILSECGVTLPLSSFEEDYIISRVNSRVF